MVVLCSGNTLLNLLVYLCCLYGRGLDNTLFIYVVYMIVDSITHCLTLIYCSIVFYLYPDSNLRLSFMIPYSHIYPFKSFM